LILLGLAGLVFFAIRSKVRLMRKITPQNAEVVNFASRSDMQKKDYIISELLAIDEDSSADEIAVQLLALKIEAEELLSNRPVQG